MQIGEYTLSNPDKVERAINGTVLDHGSMKGGVGPDATEAEIIAEYDRLGGLILKDNKYKVKTGSFYDFKGKKAFAKPKPMLIFQVNGETVEVDADKQLPIEVRAAEIADNKKKAKGGKKGKKAKEESDDEDDADGEDLA